jgi:hypothetical protein
MTRLRDLSYYVLVLDTRVSCGQRRVMTPSTAVPAAEATATIAQDSPGHAESDLQVKYLAQPQKFPPPKSRDVVWAETPAGHMANLGRLVIERRGTFRSVTPLHEFLLLITAEALPLIEAPSPDVVLSTEVFCVQ